MVHAQGEIWSQGADCWPTCIRPCLGNRKHTGWARRQRSLTSWTHSPGRGTGSGPLHPTGKQENRPERETLQGKHVGPKLLPRKGPGGLPAQSRSQFLGDTAVRRYSLKPKGGGKRVCKERGVPAAKRRVGSASSPAPAIPVLMCLQTSPAHPYVQMTEVTVRVQLAPRGPASHGPGLRMAPLNPAREVTRLSRREGLLRQWQWVVGCPAGARRLELAPPTSQVQAWPFPAPVSERIRAGWEVKG